MKERLNFIKVYTVKAKRDEGKVFKDFAQNATSLSINATQTEKVNKVSFQTEPKEKQN